MGLQIQSFTVSIDRSGKTVPFSVKTKPDMQRIKGVAFHTIKSSHLKGTDFTLTAGTQAIVQDRVEVDMFTYSESLHVMEAKLPLDIEAKGETLSGDMKDGGTQTSFEPYEVKIYIIGEK